MSNSNLPNSVENLLLKIFIGQNIRSEGILQTDFDYDDATTFLLSKDFIVENHWHLSQYKTTEKGSELGKELVNERISRHSQNIQNKLSSFPSKGLKFLIKNHIQKALDFNSEKQPFFYNWDEQPISDTRIWLLKQNLFKTLEEAELCVLTRNYVSTRGGETRDKHYVISPEIQQFLLNLPIIKPTDDDGFVKDEKISLKVLFVLKEIGHLLDNEDLDFIRRRFYEHLSDVSVDEKPINKIVDEMSNFGITTEYYGLLSSKKPFEIKDKSRYDIYIREELLNPVINSLLGENVTTIKFDVMPSKLSEVKTELGFLDNNERGDFYLLVSSVEQQLRELIKEGLGKKWLERLENDLPAVVENWKTKEKKDREWGIEPEKELIDYADFGDYSNIFTTYKKLFSKSNEDLGDAKVQLKNWYNYGRNPIMHSRTIDKEKFYSTKTAINWIVEWISRRRNYLETSKQI